MATEKLYEILFYVLEKSIKNYRQFAQKNISKEGIDITIDQWLVLKTLQEKPEITQQEIGAIVFKDDASVTRIIELLVTKGYIKRSFHAIDRRRFNLTITKAGAATIESLQPVITRNRKTALNGVSKEELRMLTLVLYKIISNCQS